MRLLWCALSGLESSAVSTAMSEILCGPVVVRSSASLKIGNPGGPVVLVLLQAPQGAQNSLRGQE